MLTPLATKEDDQSKPSIEFYSTPTDQQHYYYPTDFYDSNRFYSHSHSVHDDPTVYMPIYSHPYSNEDLLYSNATYDPQTTYTYDYNPPPPPPSVPATIINNEALIPYSSLDGAPQPGPIVVELANRSLWQKFAPHTLENIITKTGRRMFPTLEYKIYGLKPDATYNMYIDMVLVDENHWKFNSGKWVPSGQVEQCQKTHQIYLHPDSPNSGAHWMRNEKVSFSKLKLTNNKQLPSTHPQHQMTLVLNSMHKYIPRLHIVEVNDRSCDLNSMEKSSNSSKEIFTFPETQFIAVTAYQNTDVTQLKIDNNPFAKGFRDSGENRTIYPSYSYGSPSPPYPTGNSIALDYYGTSYDHPYKKKRHH